MPNHVFAKFTKGIGKIILRLERKSRPHALNVGFLLQDFWLKQQNSFVNSLFND